MNSEQLTCGQWIGIVIGLVIVLTLLTLLYALQETHGQEPVQTPRPTLPTQTLTPIPVYLPVVFDGHNPTEPTATPRPTLQLGG